MRQNANYPATCGLPRYAAASVLYNRFARSTSGHDELQTSPLKQHPPNFMKNALLEEFSN